MPLPLEILNESQVLFRDVRPEDVDAEAHAEFVIARVLDHGTVRSVRALLGYYGPDRIRAFFRGGGADRVSRRTVPLWVAFLNLAPGTIRTINGVFARVVDGRPLMRPRPPAGTARPDPT